MTHAQTPKSLWLSQTQAALLDLSDEAIPIHLQFQATAKTGNGLFPCSSQENYVLQPAMICLAILTTVCEFSPRTYS